MGAGRVERVGGAGREGAEAVGGGESERRERERGGGSGRRGGSGRGGERERGRVSGDNQHIIHSENEGYEAGAHPRGGPEGPGPSPWDLKTTRFSVFLPSNYVIFVFASRVLKLLRCGRTEEACSMVKSLRKVYFWHPTGHYL